MEERFETLWLGGRYTDALRAAEERKVLLTEGGAEHHPRFIRVLTDLGLAARSLGQLSFSQALEDQAVALFASLSQENERSPSAAFLVFEGRRLMNIGAMEKARQCFSDALNLLGYSSADETAIIEKAEALAQAAEVEFVVGETARAIALYSAALDIFADYPNVDSHWADKTRAGLVLAYCEEKQYRRALPLFDDLAAALRGDRFTPQVKYALLCGHALALEDAAKWQAAAALRQEAESLKPAADPARFAFRAP